MPLVPTYDDGGLVAPSATVPAGPPQMLGASPQVQQLYQRYQQMPLNQLQRLAVMTPPISPQGQMIQRALKAKQMAPAANGAFPSLRQPPVGSPPPAGYASGGSSTGDGGLSMSSFKSPGYGIDIPQISYRPGVTGLVGPTWSPGDALLSPSSPATTTPPGFGGIPATPPKVTELPASVLNASAPAAPAAAPQPFTLTSQQAQMELANGNLSIGQLESMVNSGQLTIIPQAQYQSYGSGGLVPMRASGGFPSLAQSDAQDAGTLLRSTDSTYHPGGFIHSPVGGRTDHLALSVPADAHIIPADVVSGIGQGNGLNGGALLDAMFHSGPWGVRAQMIAGARPRFPNPPPPAQLAAGGRPERTTDIMAAGGEYIVRPEAVAFFGRAAKRLARGKLDGKRDMHAGHDAIDAFILRARRHAIATMRKLPGPIKG
jgi:hypothetical protein